MSEPVRAYTWGLRLIHPDHNLASGNVRGARENIPYGPGLHPTGYGPGPLPLKDLIFYAKFDIKVAMTHSAYIFQLIINLLPFGAGPVS